MLSIDTNPGYLVSSGNSSPFQYTFNQIMGSGDNSQQWTCHMWFSDTEVGNTITFGYVNTQGNSPTTWQQNSQLQSAYGAAAASSTGSASGAAIVTQTVTATVSASTFLTTVSQPSTTFVETATAAAALLDTSQSPSASNTNSSSGLSTGAAAGIGVAAAAIFFGGAIVAYLIWHQSRKNKQQGPIATPHYGTQQGSRTLAMSQSTPYPVGPTARTQPAYHQLNNAQGVHEVQG